MARPDCPPVPDFAPFVDVFELSYPFVTPAPPAPPALLTVAVADDVDDVSLTRGVVPPAPAAAVEFDGDEVPTPPPYAVTESVPLSVYVKLLSPPADPAASAPPLHFLGNPPAPTTIDVDRDVPAPRLTDPR
jgi:hypothetical protein